MMRRIRAWTILGGVIALVVSVVMLTGNAWAVKYAVNLNNTYINKMILSSTAQCIQNYGVINRQPMDVSQYSMGDRRLFAELFSTSATQLVPLPSFVTNMRASEVSCRNLFVGDAWLSGGRGTFQGVMGLFGVSDMTLQEQLVLFGFEPQTTASGTNTSTKSLQFVTSSGLTTQSNTVTVSKSGNSVVASPESDNYAGECSGYFTNNIMEITSSGSGYNVRFNNGFCQKYDGVYVGMSLSSSLPVAARNELTLNGVDFPYNGNTIEGFYEALQNAVKTIGGATITYEFRGGGNYRGVSGNIINNFDATYVMQEEAVSATDTGYWESKGESSAVVALRVVQHLSGGVYNLGNLYFTPEQALDYYVAQLTQHYFDGQDMGTYWVCDDTIASGTNLKQINLMPTSGTTFARPSNSETCKIRTNYANNDNKSDIVNGFSAPTSYIDSYGDTVYSVNFKNSRKMNMPQMIDAINELVEIALEVGESTDISGDASGAVTPTTPPATQDGETVCKANAGVLGWILCPIIKAISGIGEHMWNQVEQNHLKIQAREMFVNNTGVKDAFDIVRNISNIAFIILFMFVIFSQLTGVGIDNYGIKRILPRLILVAILTNLSYYICEAAVDVSNIFGAGLNDMLTGFANNIGYGRDSMGALAGGLAIDALLTGGGVAIFLTLNPMGAVGGAIWIAFAVFGVIVSMVAAMLVLYLIVVIREAAIIIMVVLAPVAIVCYALPNTEKIYKRWFDIFKALLIVYPICGAMVGAGRLAAAVLGQINTQSMAIAAMIVQVIPFFLIPMLLKNSLAALGNIGAKISNAGRSLSKRASGAVTNGIRNSARFKDFEQFQKDKTTAERAKKIAEGRLGSKIDALRSKGENNLSKSEKSRLRRYESRMARANAVLREDERRSLENQIGSIQSVQDAELAKQRLGIQESTADTLLYANDDFVDAQLQKGDNARRDRLAEAEVGVLELDRDLARNRAQSRKDTQEYKAYQDQYAGYDRKRLTEDARSASTWMNQAGGAQRMSALLQALEANGLEKEMFDMLDKNDVSKMTGAAMVMQTLSGSKNKVAKAYGKKAIDTETGKTVSYREFMTGTGSQSMRAYMDGKGSSFADGLDDKALFQIRNMGTSMRTGELIDFASKLTDNDSIKEVNEMISAKIANGETFQMNGKQLSNMHDSTMIRMLAGQNGRDALLTASDDLSPELLANTDATVKIRLNALRSANNKPPLGTPQTPPKPQGESFNDGGGI